MEETEYMKVLLVEDNPGDARLLQEMLATRGATSFDLNWTDRLSKGLEQLAEKDIDVILLDLSLPDSQGLDTFAQVHTQAPQVPVIVLSGLDDEEVSIKAVREGAQDYLIKGQVDGNLLTRAIRYAIERKQAEEQVQQQERLAAVGQLAGGIAHDFNNFLTTIMLHAHLLLRMEDLPLRATGITETILSESRRAAQLVRQILDFSRRSMMETEPINLVAFIAETVDILRKTLPENIRLVTEIGQERYVVNADPTRIQQIVMNLALNARDVMPEGGELRIRLSKVEIGSGEKLPVADTFAAEMSDGRWVCLAISDTGTGMTEEVRSHIFEPFFTTKGPKGTGLGLAQVYGIVKQHEGHIGMDTELGRGTTFRVYLPAYDETKVEESSEGVSIAPEGKGETILLVEDEEKVREAGQWILESLGYRVLTASNGREGLEVYRATDRVDLVVTDMVMPDMGGKELIQELRRTEPGIKTLAITGYVMQEELQDLREGGVMEIVHKPLEASTLGKAIRRILDEE
jgi:two-component system cell cycle sensor histidine kinase/response regulator CckA